MMTVEEVAKHLNLDSKTVKAVDYKCLQKEFGVTDYFHLRVLAIDEIAVKKGHRYMTVVLDYLTGRVVWMGEGRRMETLDDFFKGMSVEQKESIEAVAMDMWEPYINRVRHHCPQAKLVFDFFHVVKAFGQVIDEVRRDEYRKATSEDKKVIQGSRYLLLKNLENLTDPQRDRLDDLRNLNETINRVYLLKDQLKTLYWYTNREYAGQALENWCVMADRIDHPAAKKFAGRLRFFKEGILNHCDCPIDTGRLEGVNNKIKLIKRRAFGYHDPDYFALKVKQAFPGRPATPPNNT
jgi:transposase